MSILTEDRIKVASLRFLKDHYKFHPRKGSATAQFDMKGEDGIIADGQLFFTSEEGHQFLATFEATSDQIFEEVKYRQENRVLFWDSLAAGFITATLTFLIGHFQHQFTIREVGWPTTLSILFFAGMLGFWLYHYLVRKSNRYRYIYAIEQFKRYHADDQWIAISDTIFPFIEEIIENPYLEELKRQCVKNGIGLIAVSRDEKVQLLIAPARQDEFGNRRKIIHFVGQSIKRSKSLGRRISDKGRNFLDKLFGRAKNSSSLQRYRRSFYKQIITCFFATALMTLIFYRQMQDRPMEYISTEEFEQSVLQQVAEGDMETLEYLKDTAALVKEGTYKSSYLDIEYEERPEERIAKAKEMEVWKIDLNSEESGSVYLNSEGDEYNSYDCQRLFNFSGKLYLISYSLFPDFESAKVKIGQLAQSGLDANMLWLGCFKNKDQEYVLYFDLLYPEKEAAAERLLFFQRRLVRAGFEEEGLRLVEIGR